MVRPKSNWLGNQTNPQGGQAKKQGVKNPKAIKSLRKGSKRHQAIADQLAEGYSPHFGFLHIPKTGGSGLTRLGKELVARGYQFPCIFGHNWKVEEILAHFPDMRLCFILRDPLSRMISGFNSRLAQGRPTYNSMWSPREAAAFALLPSAKHLLNAILSDEEYQQSALKYAMHVIRHLRWNYTFYFEDLKTVKARASHFELIGNIASTYDFIERITALSGAPPALAAELYQKVHESKIKSQDILASYDEDELSRIRNFISKEIRIYDQLLHIAGSK